MIIIRKETFETNSSSTHSIAICSKEEFDKWIARDLYFDACHDKFVTKEEYKELEEKNDADDLYTYEAYFDDDYLEGFERNYTSKSGDNIVAFGKYGYDG